jgi:hypothetical protein
MSTTSDSPSSTPSADRQQLIALLEKVLPFARTADALARRIVGKVRTLALLGALAALWIVYACVRSFDWSLATALAVFVPVALPAVALWKMHGVLRSTVGLPERIVDTATRMQSKFAEYRQWNESRQASAAEVKPKFRQLWDASKQLLQLKALGDDAQKIASVAGGALVLANPMFAVLLGIAAASTVVVVLIAAVTAFVYL